MAEGPRGWLLAGTVGSAHGLDGSFYVNEAKPQLLELGTQVVVSGRELKIDRRAGADRRPILRLEGYRDRAAAQSLRGQQLMIPRRDAPELEPDEWWAEDLEGCVVTTGERRIGKVRKLLALPSCEVLEVERDEGQGDLLVPLVSDAVRSVDVEQQQIEIDLAFLGED